MSDTSWRANHITSVGRAVGGKLTVEDGSITFRPHRFDRALSATDWSAPLSSLSVSVADRRPLSHLFGAGLRRQLCLSSDGDEHHFVVNHVDRVAEAILALGAAGPAAG